jgi:uncharacterized repeat protein (TIGR03803 family)
MIALAVAPAFAQQGAYVADYTVLHTFTQTLPDPSTPTTALIVSSDGNYYGTTNSGGASGLGTVFMMTQAGAVTVLHSFNGKNGSRPTGLIELATGDLIGTTYNGGTAGAGIVFKVTKAGKFTVLHDLNGTTDGNLMAAPLLRAKGGLMYGATTVGGAGCGTVFSISKTGTFSVVYTFPGNGANGCQRKGALIQAADDWLYGTAESGGDANEGTVFRMNAAGTSFTRLATFGGAAGAGRGPTGGLVQGPDSALYGVTYGGGSAGCSIVAGCGTAFRMTTDGVLSYTHQFTDQVAPTAAYPHGPLYIGTDNRIHGVTEGGGSVYGTIYSMSNWGYDYSVDHVFDYANGANPMAGLAYNPTDYNLYGTASTGSTRAGVVFVIPQVVYH